MSRYETDMNHDIREAYRAAKKAGRVCAHLKIAEASRVGRGVRLTVDECDELVRDEMFIAAALEGYPCE